MEQTKLTKAHVRLELLKLTYNNVHTVDVIVEKMRKLEDFILEEEKDSNSGSEKNLPQTGAKKSGQNKKDDKLFT